MKFYYYGWQGGVGFVSVSYFFLMSWESLKVNKFVGEFNNLFKYKYQVIDYCVIVWVIDYIKFYCENGKWDMEFIIEVMVVIESEDGKCLCLMWERLY